MEHEPSIVPVQKMDAYGSLYRGACSCRWRSPSFGTEHDAWRDARQHATAKNRASVGGGI